LVLHCVELVLFVLDEPLQLDTLITTDKDLLAEVLDGFLALEKNTFHDGDGLRGQFGVIVLGKFDHSLQNCRLD
jgi:hypothetical protein